MSLPIIYDQMREDCGLDVDQLNFYMQRLPVSELPFHLGIGVSHNVENAYALSQTQFQLTA